MRYAILSDLHANIRAWTAVYRDLRGQGVDTILCLGDVVGYGPSPARVLEEVYAVCDNFVLGNHDAVISDQLDASCFNDEARFTIEWTRKTLNDDAADFFKNVPLTLEGGDFLLTHAEVEQPGRFDYLYEPAEAIPHFAACPHRLIFVGHTHFPCAIYSEAPGQGGFLPNEDLELNPSLRYLINVGSVGDPRNGDTRAHYVIYDDETGMVQFRKVPFDVEAYRHDLVQSGLPTRPILFDYLGRPLPEATAPAPLQSARDGRALSEMQPVELPVPEKPRVNHATIHVGGGLKKPSATFRQLQETEARNKARNRILSLIGGAVLLLAAAGGAWWALQPKSPPPPPVQNNTVSTPPSQPEAPPELPPLPELPSDALVAWSFEDGDHPYKPSGWLSNPPRTGQELTTTLREDKRGHALSLVRSNSRMELTDPRLLRLPADAPWSLMFELQHDGLDGELVSSATSPYGEAGLADWQVALESSCLVWELDLDGRRLRLKTREIGRGDWVAVQFIWTGEEGRLWLDGELCPISLSEVSGKMPARSAGGFRVGAMKPQRAATANIDRIQIYLFEPAPEFLTAWARHRLPHFNLQHATGGAGEAAARRAAWDTVAQEWRDWAVPSEEPGPVTTEFEDSPYTALHQHLKARRTADREAAMEVTRGKLRERAGKLPLTTGFGEFAANLEHTAAPWANQTIGLRDTLLKEFRKRVVAERNPLVPGVPTPLLELAAETARLLVVQDTPNVPERLGQLFGDALSTHPDLRDQPGFAQLKEEALSISRLPLEVMRSFEEELGVPVVIETVDGSVTGVVREVVGPRRVRLLARRPGGIQVTRMLEYGQLLPGERLKRLAAGTTPTDEAKRGILEASLGEDTAYERFDSLSDLLGLHLMRVAPRIREEKAAAEVALLRERLGLPPDASFTRILEYLFRNDNPRRRASLQHWLDRFTTQHGTKGLPEADRRVVYASRRYLQYSTVPLQQQCQLAASMLAHRAEAGAYPAEHPPRGTLDLTTTGELTSRSRDSDGPLIFFDKDTHLTYASPRSFRDAPLTLFLHVRMDVDRGVPHQDVLTLYDKKSEEAPALRLQILNPGRWALTLAHEEGKAMLINPKCATSDELRQFHFLTIDREGQLSWWIDGVQVLKEQPVEFEGFDHVLLGAGWDPVAKEAGGRGFIGMLKDVQIYSTAWDDAQREGLFAYLRKQGLLENTSKVDRGLRRFEPPKKD